MENTDGLVCSFSMNDLEVGPFVDSSVGIEVLITIDTQADQMFD